MSDLVLSDPRLAEGMARQRDARAAVLYDGARRLGWKVGLNGAGAQQAFGVDAPVAGFLTDATLVQHGATVSLDGWQAPMLEAEVAVRMGAAVPGDATRDEAAAAVDALAPAIELVDFGSARLEIADVLAGNIFHRAVVLGAWDTTRAGLRLDGVALDLHGSAADVSGADPEASGDIAEFVRHTAWFLAAAGEQLDAGDVLITGAIVPPVAVAGGQHVQVDLGGLGVVSVRFTEGSA